MKRSKKLASPHTRQEQLLDLSSSKPVAGDRALETAERQGGNGNVPAPLAFLPQCSHCACRTWRYGLQPNTRIARKECASCGAPWPDQVEEEMGELWVPDPVLVLDYCTPRRLP